MSPSKLQLLHSLRDNLLRPGVHLSDAAGDVHSGRVAADEGTVAPPRLSRHHPEGPLFRRVPGLAHSRGVLHVSGKFDPLQRANGHLT